MKYKKQAVRKWVLFAAVALLLIVQLIQATTAAADATDDLILKQSKLVQKWGVKKADEVVSKAFGIGEAGRISDLKKIVNAMPENLIDDFSPDRAVKFLGNKDVIKGAEELAKSFDKATIAKFAGSADDFEAISKAAGKVKNKFGSLDDLYPALKSCLGITGFGTASVCSPADIEKITVDLKALGHDVVKLEGKFGKQAVERLFDAVKLGVADLSKVSPESVAKVMKGYGKVNPFDAGEQTLVKILKAQGKQTVIGSEKVDGILVLRKGNGLLEGKTAWGFDHGMKHVNEFKETFGISDPESIKKIIEEVIESGKKGISTDPGVKEVLEKTVTYNDKTNLVRVPYVIKETSYGALPGDIATFFPVK